MASWTAAFAFDFSGPLQAVDASLQGNTVTYRVTDPGRGVREGSWTGPGGFISQPTTAGGVVAWLAGSTVHYRIYDPGPGLWREGSTTSPAGVYVSEPKNLAGVVAWIAGTTVYYRVYDPAFGAWRNGSSSSSPGMDPNNRDGVVVWVAGSTVQYRVYDPNVAVWKEGSNATPRVIISDPANAGGVVAWAAGNSVYCRIYDPAPGRAAWRTTNWMGAGEYISTPQISNGTVTWTAGSQNYVRSYNPNSGAWMTNGATLPYASFVAFPMSGNAPLFVWFTDLSFGASSWAWNFGDGGTSGQRIPFHTFTSFGRFTVTQTVSGPAGTASANKIIQSDISPPTGSILINGGATHTRSNSVTLTLSATDNSGGPMMMRFSNNGSTWNNWSAFATSYPWLLSSGDGLKTVYAQFKDASDNSATNSDTINLDTRPLPAVSFNTNAVAVSENISSTMFKVSLSVTSVFTVTVDYATSSGSATAGSDYSTLNGTLTFAPGETNKMLSLSISNDALVEPNETLSLNLSNPGNAILGAYQTTTVTILDDDPPQIAFLASNFPVSESETHGVITVSLNAQSGMAVSVNYGTTNGTATAGSDYAAVAGRLDFMPGQVTRTFNVPLSDDNVDEPDETLFLKLSSPSNATLGTVSSATLTILDDDLPRASFSSDLFFVDEGTSEAIITVQLSTPYAQTVYVSYSTANGTALAGSDYSAASGTLVFASGQTNRTFVVTILNDSLNETNETVRLNITELINATPGSITSSILTILDDASRPLLISPRIQPGGIFQFSLIGPTGRRYALEASSNLVNWLELMRRTNLNGQLEFTEPATSRWRFYRAKQLD